MWDILETGAWIVSFILIAYIVIDWFRTDRSYSNEMLTSSREGELEAETERLHREEAKGGQNG